LIFSKNITTNSVSMRYVPGSLLDDMGMVQQRLSEAAKKRLRAGRMLQEGKGCAEVALTVGVAQHSSRGRHGHFFLSTGMQSWAWLKDLTR
jgi:hypothetical protein